MCTFVRAFFFFLRLAPDCGSKLPYGFHSGRQSGRIEITTTAGYGFVALTGTRRHHRFWDFWCAFLAYVGITESFITGRPKRVLGVPTESGFMVV